MRANSKYSILIAAALIAALTAVMVRNHLSKSKSAVQTNRILVAKRDMSPGMFIKAATDIDWAVPTGDQEDEPHIREGTIKRGDFNGGVVRKAIKANTAITPEQITKAGDGGFLSAVLEPGMRAVSIAVNATTGAAGFIAPGDRVDLIVTHRMQPVNNSENRQDTVISETFVRDVRVVAVDQSIDSVDAKAVIAKNVTVEVREEQAEQISVASEMGKISLSLRSSVPEDNAEMARERGNTKDSDISPVLSRKSTVMPRVQVIRGEEKEEIQFIQQGQ